MLFFFWLKKDSRKIWQLPYIKDILILWILTQDQNVCGLRVINLELVNRTFLTIDFFPSNFRLQGRKTSAFTQLFGSAVVKLSSSSFCSNSRRIVRGHSTTTRTKFYQILTPHPPQVDKNKHFTYYLSLYKKVFFLWPTFYSKWVHQNISYVFF